MIPGFQSKPWAEICQRFQRYPLDSSRVWKTVATPSELQRPAVENNLAQATGLDQNSAGSLVELVAPLVMGAVGRTQQQQGLDPSGLAQYLGEQQEETAAAPGMMGKLSSMLDSNQDGDVKDDLARIAGNLFK